MIRPNMAGTYDEARRVAARKSIWAVEYLRARREAASHHLSYRRQAALSMKAFFRRRHFNPEH